MPFLFFVARFPVNEEKYNAMRLKAVKIRNEMAAQREAAGFVVNNTEIIQELFPIPSAL
jgi:hypothetical protein